MKNWTITAFAFLILAGWGCQEAEVEQQTQAPASISAPTTESESETEADTLPLPVGEEKQDHGVFAENLVRLILGKEVDGMAMHIDFPLDARASNAFGLPSATNIDSLTQAAFLANWNAFFSAPLLEKLKNGGQSYSLVNEGYKEGHSYFTFSVQTLAPWEEDPGINMECSHSIYCRVQAGKLLITGFNLLCGGVA